MKKLLLILFIAAFMIPVSVTAEESEFYMVTLLMVEISPHEEGYVVDYYDSMGKIQTVYLPMEWFRGTPAESSCQIVYGEGQEYPYMTVYYKNAVLHHIRLYVFENQTHDSWSIVSATEDITGRFDVDSIENLVIKY